MNDELDLIAIGDLQCIAVGWPQDARFAYLPASPCIESPQGTPVAGLLDLPSGAQLSLQAVWETPEAAVAAARAALEARHPSQPASLQPAALANVVATLRLTCEDGTALEFGPRPASATAANRVVFSERLTVGQAACAREALRGRVGRLSLDFEGDLALDSETRVALSGDLAPTVKMLAPPVQEKSSGLFRTRKPVAPPRATTLAECEAALDAALAAGTLKAQEDASAHASASVGAQARADLLAELARTLFDKLHQLGADARYLGAMPVQLSRTLPETRSVRLHGCTDLGAALARHAEP